MSEISSNINKKFDFLPDQMELDAHGRLRLDKTEIDMVPAGLKGIVCIILGKKPIYVAPDFEGIVLYCNPCYHPQGKFTIDLMGRNDIKAAQNRYIAYREMVEQPRYIHGEDGSLTLCSLPTNMRIFAKSFLSDYCLDLTQTTITKKQNLIGFKEIILYPKKNVQQEFPFVLAQKITHHKGVQMTHQKPRIKE